MQPPAPTPWWRPDVHQDRRPRLIARNRIASAFRGRALPAATAAFGELGLSGEVRGVAQRSRRIAEARKLGFRTIVAPPGGSRDANEDGVIVAPDVSAAIGSVLS